MTNAEYAQLDERFKVACEVAGVSASKRQASKFRREEGLAFKKARAFVQFEAKQELTMLSAEIKQLSIAEAELHNQLAHMDSEDEQYEAIANERMTLGRRIDQKERRIVEINAQLETLRNGGG